MLGPADELAIFDHNGYLSIRYISQGVHTSHSADLAHPGPLDNRTTEWITMDAVEDLRGLYGALDADKCVLPRRSMR